MICMNDVEQTEVDWLWYPYIPFGKLTIVQGNLGEGKTFFAMQLMLSRFSSYAEVSPSGKGIHIIGQCDITKLPVHFDDRSLMEKLSGLNRDEQATILMVTHDSNAASFCKRILFIQDGVIFHELRRGDESQQEFYGRILKVMAQLGGGSANVL